MDIPSGAVTGPRRASCRHYYTTPYTPLSTATVGSGVGLLEPRRPGAFARSRTASQQQACLSGCGQVHPGRPIATIPPIAPSLPALLIPGWHPRGRPLPGLSGARRRRPGAAPWSIQYNDGRSPPSPPGSRRGRHGIRPEWAPGCWGREGARRMLCTETPAIAAREAERPTKVLARTGNVKGSFDGELYGQSPGPAPETGVLRRKTRRGWGQRQETHSPMERSRPSVQLGSYTKRSSTDGTRPRLRS